MVPFFHTLFTPFSHDFHTHSPSSGSMLDYLNNVNSINKKAITLLYKTVLQVMKNGHRLIKRGCE